MEVHRLLCGNPYIAVRAAEAFMEAARETVPGSSSGSLAEWIASVHHFKFQIKKVYLIFADEEVESERPFQGQELRLKGGMQENARGEGGDVLAGSSGLG